MTARTALTVAQDLYDARDPDTGEHRDLLQHEQVFLDAVDRIRGRKVDSYRAANRSWGDVPKMYRMCLHMADKTCADALAVALAKYDAAHSAAMEEA